MIKTLIDNNYSLDFVFATMNNRIKSLSHKYDTEEKTYMIIILIINQKRFFFLILIYSVPYFNIISEKFKSISYKFSFNIALQTYEQIS